MHSAHSSKWRNLPEQHVEILSKSGVDMSRQCQCGVHSKLNVWLLIPTKTPRHGILLGLPSTTHKSENDSGVS
jgi:hypothetical protein